MKLVNFVEVKFEQIEINGIPALFTDSRIDRTTIPTGLFAYDIREDNNGHRNFATIEPVVKVNHLYTIVTEKATAITEGGFALVSNIDFFDAITYEEWRTKNNL